MGKLTAVAVRNAKAGRHADGDGLYLLVKPTGAKSWMLRVQSDGRRRDIGLGSTTLIGLAEARDKATAARKLARDGGDPVAERKRVKVVIPTFAEAAASCHDAMKGGWRNAKHAAQWLQTLKTYIYPTFGNVRVDQVNTPMIRDALEPIWQAKPETAKRVHQRISSVLDFAQSKGWRHTDTPRQSVLKGLSRQRSSGNHFAAMPFDDVPAFMHDLRSRAQTAGRLALQFTILTAARSGEVRGATWAEIDLDTRLWKVPKERMKAHYEHSVPLSDAAMAVLTAVRPLTTGQADKPLFPGQRGGPLSDMTLSKILRDAELPFTVHGFRSSFRDWVAEKTDVPGEIAEKALAHTIPNKVEAAYLRSELLAKRRLLMDMWAAFCEGEDRIGCRRSR